MNEAVIVAARRTPIGRIQGGLASVRPDDLLSLVYKQLVQDLNLDPTHIADAIAGCANQAGEDNRNVSRMAVLLAGLPQQVPGVTVNRLCGSSLDAAIQAARCIRLDEGACYLVGGVESMSRAPWSMAKPEKAFPVGNPKVYDTVLGWRFHNPKMAELFPLEAMGETAENLVEKYNISREDQDVFAFNSHQKALAAWEQGAFDHEVIPVEVQDVKHRKSTVTISKDEGPRANSTLEKLGTLKAAFREGGSVTAGNSSTLNDGAAGLVMCSKEFAEQNSMPILATVKGYAVAGVDPDCIELNEAFASQSLAVIQALGLPQDIVNMQGGGIALGHPLGCSGARILTTLVHQMQQKDLKRGLATMCIGVGQGIAMTVER
jgi:acetyl-CoA acyltransferase